MSTNPVVADNDYNDYSNNFNRVENFAWTLLDIKNSSTSLTLMHSKQNIRYVKSQNFEKKNKLAPCESSDYEKIHLK